MSSIISFTLCKAKKKQFSREICHRSRWTYKLNPLAQVFSKEKQQYQVYNNTLVSFTYDSVNTNRNSVSVKGKTSWCILWEFLWRKNLCQYKVWMSFRETIWRKQKKTTFKELIQLYPTHTQTKTQYILKSFPLRFHKCFL